MGNFSAREYVARFSPDEANAYPWEWLHLQGSRLGGPNRPENLVAGTAEANTQMIPYERSIFELSLIATRLKPVDVTWTATVRKDADGHDTQIGKIIEIKLAFPKGEPTESKHVNPKRIAALFPVKFDVSEGAVFTKRDRDLLENIKQE